MPENLRLLKGRIRTAKNIAQIAKTLEMVSVSKIRRARGLAETVRPYAERITRLLATVLSTFSPKELTHPYLRAASAGASGNGSAPGRILLAVGPDKGLCGPLTSNLLRRMSEQIDEHTWVIGVGKRLAAPLSRMAGQRLIASFPIGLRLPQYSLVFEISRVVDEYILSGKAVVLDVLYTRFVSYFSQVPTLARILPLQAGFHTAAAPAEDHQPTLEPDPESLLNALLPHFLEVRLFDALIQAYSSEQAARMVAMQSAKSNALDIAESFTLLYNKTRQERITSEILDLANKGKRE